MVESQVNTNRFARRAAAPRYIRYASLGLIVLAVIGIGVGFYLGSRRGTFRMQGFPTSLSKDVVASVQSYERTEFDGDVRKYYVKADHATTFSDQHQELENPYFEIFSSDGATSDKITAEKAIYIPEENKNFKAFLAGTVHMLTRDGLVVRTEQITYQKVTDTAVAEEKVDFGRDNIAGSSTGATVKITEKKIELLKDVAVFQYDNTEHTGDALTAIHAGSGGYDQAEEKIWLQNSVSIHATDPKTSRLTDLTADSAEVFLKASDTSKRELSSASATGNVKIDSKDERGKTTLKAASANFNAAEDVFVMESNVDITAENNSEPVNAKAEKATYERKKGLATLERNAEISQGSVYSKADLVRATLDNSNKLKDVTAEGNAYIRKDEPDRVVESSGATLSATLGPDQTLASAKALRNAKVTLTPKTQGDFSRADMTTPGAIDLVFRSGGTLEKMLTEGRTTILLSASTAKEGSTDKRITADTVTTAFSGDGKYISSASAVGSAELLIASRVAQPGIYNTQINAARFDCDFFPTGNAARSCRGGTPAKTIRVPTKPDDSHGTQVLESATVTADFLPDSNDVERLSANGNARFSELDRHGTANDMVYTTSDKTVRLRNGEPTVWDSKARAKAPQIDLNTELQRSYLSGGVSTTYYNQKTTDNSAPFGSTKDPVYITADSAEIDHSAETAVYTGNARSWQGKNYVRGNRLTIQQRAGKFDADGGVQSLLYDVKKKENGKETTVPVSVTARSMSYFRDDRMIRYIDDVDMRQGSDRIVAGRADIFLDNKNELNRAEMEGRVVITQPNRKATADQANYDVPSQIVMLRGNPATVADPEKGNSQAAMIKMNLSDKSVLSEGATVNNPSSRTRSVYKVTEN